MRSRKRFFRFCGAVAPRGRGLETSHTTFFCVHERSSNRPIDHQNRTLIAAARGRQSRHIFAFWRPLAARQRRQIHNLATLQFHMKPNIRFYIFNIFYAAFT